MRPRRKQSFSTINGSVAAADTDRSNGAALASDVGRLAAVLAPAKKRHLHPPVSSTRRARRYAPRSPLRAREKEDRGQRLAQGRLYQIDGDTARHGLTFDLGRK